MTKKATFGAGCFWGVEAAFRRLDGVEQTRVGYAGGSVENPTYEQVCSHETGHAEVVEVTYDESTVPYEQLLAVFWAEHDPTQLNRQGPDVGDQYRSAIFLYDEDQRRAAEASREAYQKELAKSGYGEITTEIVDAPDFYYAEDYHQQYLARNPHGYCGLGGTGLSCPVGVGLKA